MQRSALTALFPLLSVMAWIAVVGVADAQDRAGAMPGGQAMQQAPAPAVPPAIGNVGIGAIPITQSPAGYYAQPRAADYNVGKFFYYPYYYFPHNYWPTQTCKWPERPGEPYMRPPAYMSYPPFLEPHWRYEWYVPQKYYRGFHFWLDQF